MSISHDSVNRFLHREAYTGQDLFNEAKTSLNLNGIVYFIGAFLLHNATRLIRRGNRPPLRQTDTGVV